MNNITQLGTRPLPLLTTATTNKYTWIEYPTATGLLLLANQLGDARGAGTGLRRLLRLFFHHIYVHFA